MDAVELRNVFLYSTFRFFFWSDDIVLSTFTKNAIKSFVIGIGVLILNLNYFPKSMVLGQKTIITFSLQLISLHKLHFCGSYEQIY